MTDVTFAAFPLPEAIQRALATAGLVTPTPIQAEAIPAACDGRDVLGIAQTGTGKTAAFVLPLLHRLAADKQRARPQSARALILAPTRELAHQIIDAARLFGRGLNLRFALVYGGVPIRKQIDMLHGGVDVLVATPGRLMDLMSIGRAKLDDVGVLVLDEADRMLDMGFVKDVRKIASLTRKDRQTLLFSATMPEAIDSLARDLLNNPVTIQIAPQEVTVDRIDQRVIHVAAINKRALLLELLQDAAMDRVVVFTRTKRSADRLAEQLEKAGVSVDSIHGDKTQGARHRALDNFKKGRARLLVATDVAARGIDVTGVSHVVNFDMPVESESYVHRIGRTARGGGSGIAVSFCDPVERGALRAIERLIGKPVPVVMEGHELVLPTPAPRRGRAEDGEALAHVGGRGGKFGANKPRAAGRPQQRTGQRPAGSASGKSDGFRGDGFKSDGFKSDGFVGPRGGATRPDAAKRADGKRFDGNRSEGKRFDGNRPEGKRPEGKRFEGGSADGGKPFGPRRVAGANRGDAAPKRRSQGR